MQFAHLLSIAGEWQGLENWVSGTSRKVPGSTLGTSPSLLYWRELAGAGYARRRFILGPRGIKMEIMTMACNYYDLKRSKIHETCDYCQ